MIMVILCWEEHGNTMAKKGELLVEAGVLYVKL